MAQAPSLVPVWSQPQLENVVDAIFAAKASRKARGGQGWKYLVRYAGNDDAHDDWQWGDDMAPGMLQRFWQSLDEATTLAGGRYPLGWVVTPNQSYIDWGILNAAVYEKEALLEMYGKFDAGSYAEVLTARTDFSLMGEHAPLSLASGNGSLRQTTRRPRRTITAPFAVGHETYGDVELRTFLVTLGICSLEEQ